MGIKKVILVRDVKKVRMVFRVMFRYIFLEGWLLVCYKRMNIVVWVLVDMEVLI